MNKGQVLNEAVIAMGIITLTVIGSFGFMAKAINYNRFISDQSTAVHLAAEGAEIAKNILDAQVLANPKQPVGFVWMTIQNTAKNNECHELDYSSASIDNTNIYNPSSPKSFVVGSDQANKDFFTYSGSGRGTSYQRKICFAQPSVNEVLITSTVTYKARNGLRNTVDTSTSIFNWR